MDRATMSGYRRQHVVRRRGLLGGLALASLGFGEALALPPPAGGPVAPRRGVVPWRLLGSVRLDEAGAVTGIPPALAALDGAMVTVEGFMVPYDDAPRQDRFLLGEAQVHCPWCSPAGLAGFVEVFARSAVAATARPVAMRGRLALNRARPGEFVFALADAARA